MRCSTVSGPLISSFPLSQPRGIFPVLTQIEHFVDSYGLANICETANPLPPLAASPVPAPRPFRPLIKDENKMFSGYLVEISLLYGHEPPTIVARLN